MQNLKNEDDLKILRYTMVCPLNKKSLISELDFRVNIICYMSSPRLTIPTTDDNYEVQTGFCLKGENP